jgi:hypothetical protein
MHVDAVSPYHPKKSGAYYFDVSQIDPLLLGRYSYIVLEAVMNTRIGRVLLAGALAVVSVIGFASHGLAQGSLTVGEIKLVEARQSEQKKRTVAPKQVAPKQVAPKREVTPRRTVTPKREVTPRRTVTPKQLETPKRTVTPKGVAPKGVTPKTVSPSGRGLRTIAIGGTGSAVVRGRNYSVWRGSHRVRHGNSWRTFAALRALSVLFIGGATYYPYAYLSAPEPVCEGETEDGCILQWQEVPTLEGPRVFQCVAYCPWQ